MTGQDKINTTWEALYLAPEFLLIPLGPSERWPKWEHFKNLESPHLMVAPSVELYLFLKTQRPATFPRYRPYNYATICDVIRNYVVSRKEKFTKGPDLETLFIGQDPLGSLLSREVIKRGNLTNIIRCHLLILGTGIDTSNWVLEPEIGHHGEAMGLNIVQHPFLRQPAKIRPIKRPSKDNCWTYDGPSHPGMPVGLAQGALIATRSGPTVGDTSIKQQQQPKKNLDNEIVATATHLLGLIRKGGHDKRTTLIAALKELLTEERGDEQTCSADSSKKQKVASLDSRGIRQPSVEGPDARGRGVLKQTLTPSTEPEEVRHYLYHATEPYDWVATNRELLNRYKSF